MEPQQVTTERRVLRDRRRGFSEVSTAGQEHRTASRRTADTRRTKLSLGDITRAAEHVAREIDPRLMMDGVVRVKGNYAEVLFSIRGCEVEPCRVIVGVNSASSLDTLRAAIQRPVEAYLRRQIH